MAAQLSWSVLGTPGTTRPRGPVRVDDVHADVREVRDEVVERCERDPRLRDGFGGGTAGGVGVAVAWGAGGWVVGDAAGFAACC